MSKKMRIVGVAVPREDAQALIVKLLAADTLPAVQAAHTIYHALGVEASVPAFSGPERDAILAALQDEPPPGLTKLRSALLIERSQREA
jgi:hypothetical protein